MKSLYTILCLCLLGCTTPPNTLESIATQSDKIINIYATDCLGTGWGIDDHTIVTCWHVIENGIIGMESPRECWRALDITYYPEDDIAFVTIPERPTVTRLNLSSYPPKLGERVYCTGYAMGTLLGVTEGDIFFLSSNIWLADLTVIPGMSGGPVLNSKSEVIGMAQAFVGTGRPLAKIIPIDVIKMRYNEFKNRGTEKPK